MRTFLIIIISAFASYAHAQEANRISATMLSAGNTNRLDTYLSPEEYRGTDIRFISSSLRLNGRKWNKEFTHEGGIDYTHNRTENGKAMAGHYDFAFAMLKPLNATVEQLDIRVGFMSELYLGFAYNMRNSSNNPAQGYASMSAGGSAIVTYRPYIFKKTIPVTYELRLPVLGAMFSPAFGQSYYELFNNGNYDSNIVLTTIAIPQFRHQLTVDLPVGKNRYIRVGYLGDYRQSKPNSLKQHTYTNSFIIGYVVGV